MYPSRLDGIGLTQAEALACGLPLITSDNAPMNQFTGHEAGFTVPVEKLWCRRDAYYWPQREVNIDALAATMQIFINKFALLSS